MDKFDMMVSREFFNYASIKIFINQEIVNMKRVNRLFLTCLLMTLSMVSMAKDMKIGIVDLQKIMQNSNQMKAIQQKLENEFKPRRDKLVAMENSLKQDMAKFKRDNAVMSQSQKKELEKKIVSAQQAFEREGQQYQQELSSAHNEAMEELYGKIKQAIAKVANQDKYDIVLQKDAAPFSAADLDITQSIMKQIN
tara:strand:+ start:2706 stop:3290 length:585 start_codon:yes stop_codon:yes gene_type:complete